MSIFNLTQKEQKILQKYELWDILKSGWQTLDQLAVAGKISKQDKVSEWQVLFDNVFEQKNLENHFRNKLFGKSRKLEGQTSLKKSNESFLKNNKSTVKNTISDNFWSNSSQISPETLQEIYQTSQNLFDNHWWQKNILPQIEHPQYTRPKIWQITQRQFSATEDDLNQVLELSVPQVLLDGNHLEIQKWRQGGWLD